MEKEITVAKITLDDNQEYYLMDRIPDKQHVYLFLVGVETNKTLIRKYELGTKEENLYPLESKEELAYAYELFFTRHPNLKTSLS